MNAIDKAVGDALNIAGAFATALTVGGKVQVYNGEAPEGTIEPFCNFESLLEVPEYFFAGGPIEDTPYQIDLYHTTKTAVGTLYDQLRAQLDDKVLTITGYGSLWCERTNAQRFREFDQSLGRDLHRYMVEYRVSVQKT